MGGQAGYAEYCPDRFGKGIAKAGRKIRAASSPALLSQKLTTSEKLDIIENEYDIPLEDNLRKDVNVMCNLSQGIVDETKAEIILNMFENNFTVEQISLATKQSVEEVERVIKDNRLVLA